LSISRIRYISKIFAKKYGATGKVASRYLQAGFSIRFLGNQGQGEEFLAAKSGVNYYVRVFATRPPSLRDIELLAKSAEKYNAKPVVVLYGRLKPLKEEVVSALKEKNITVKRVR